MSTMDYPDLAPSFTKKKTGSKIEWTGETWNSVVGCSIHSPGCQRCYAMKMAARLERMGQKQYAGLTQPSKAGPVWTGEVRFVEDALLKPFNRMKPTTYFVCSMADLFHEDVPDVWIDRVFAIMAQCPQHTFQVLTKRSARMRAYFDGDRSHKISDAHGSMGIPFFDWPLPNVWLGVSAEDQRRYIERKEDLRNTPAAVHFFSLEPLLGPIEGDYFGEWAIVGGESGHGARPLWTPWVRSIVKQCQNLNTPVFVKQMGANCQDRNDAGFDGDENEWDLGGDFDRVEHDLDGHHDGYQGAPVRVRLLDRKGGDMSEWPSDLRIRQMPAR